MTNRIGIDVGGTKIDAIVFSPSGEIIFEKRVASPKSYELIVKAVADLAKEAGPGRIGIGAPGSSSPRNGLWRNSNMVACNGKPFHADLKSAIGRDIITENDANCFALSEAIDGAGQGHTVVAFLTIGTGLGGGLVVEGKLIRGAHGEAAEFGHGGLPWMTTEDWPPIPCFCGKAGCAEMYVSGTGFVADYTRATGQALAGAEIVALARAGGVQAIAAIARLQDRFARVCANLLAIIDPDIFVIGGGMASLPELVEDLPPLVARYSFSRTALPTITRARHGGNSGVRGAAMLWGR
jgi:fructokinase